FLIPYREFLVSYMAGVVSALTATFGMGTNGYLMVVIFAYIGGLIAEQTRRELVFRSGSGSSFGLNLVQPVLGARPYVDDEEEAYEEDAEIHRSRRPVHARSRRHPAVVGLQGGHRRRDRGSHFESYRRVSARTDDEDGHHSRTRRRHEEDGEDDDEGEEVVVRRTHRIPRDRERDEDEDKPEPRHRSHHRERQEADEEPPEERPSRAVKTRSAAEERAIQRFVERALRNYDHSKL